jgi:uncharacterized protein
MRFQLVARLAATLVLWLAAPMAVEAASFKCSKATQADEKLICQDRRLNDLDVELSVRLDVLKHLMPMGQRGALMDDQSAWFVARRQCGADRACLIRRYGDRLEEVNGALTRIYRKGPF